ncbi:MAG: DJ-1/PfpI family protein [Patescibacteria group bacterium]|nr:DJ-1/PfpI family protein [Patescibacteria group bacterium]
MAKVLVVIPHDRFRDEEYLAVVDALKSSGHDFQIGSSHHTEAQGHFGLIVNPDVNVGFVEPGDYDAVIFIGGRGIEEYINESTVINLIRNFSYERKLIGAIGMAVELLVYAGIIVGKKITCDPGTISMVQSSGAYYTGKGVELDSNILTGDGVKSKDDFAKALVKALDYIDPKRGLR